MEAGVRLATPRENDKTMGHSEDLQHQDAVAKLREIIDHNATCMFHTQKPGGTLDSRPMMIQQVDDSGSLWMLSGRSSEQNAQIAADPRVMLTITDNGHSEYLVVHGEARIVDDKAKKEELFVDFAKAWFPRGVEDPELTLLEVHPVDGHYWDTRDGKVAQLLKIAGAALTGNMNDSGSVQGKIRV
jgi:general stress protein 26